jgi:hypothetical protein
MYVGEHLVIALLNSNKNGVKPRFYLIIEKDRPRLKASPYFFTDSASDAGLFLKVHAASALYSFCPAKNLSINSPKRF